MQQSQLYQNNQSILNNNDDNNNFDQQKKLYQTFLFDQTLKITQDDINLFQTKQNQFNCSFIVNDVLQRKKIYYNSLSFDNGLGNCFKSNCKVQFLCIDFQCDSQSSYICCNFYEKQKCQCEIIHQKCKIVKSQTIINQIRKKMIKPIKLQYLKFWKAKYYLWNFIKERISQQRQNIYQCQYYIHQILKTQTKKQYKQDQEITNMKISDVYLFGLTKKGYNSNCNQKKIVKQEQLSIYHKKCQCKPIKLNLLKQASLKKYFVVDTLTQIQQLLFYYDELLEKIFLKMEQHQNQLIMFNMNFFQKLIFSKIIGIQYDPFCNMSQSKRQVNGYIIYKARQYRQSYLAESTLVKLTNLFSLREKWNNIWKPYFCTSIQGNILYKSQFFSYQSLERGFIFFQQQDISKQVSQNRIQKLILMMSQQDQYLIEGK